MPDRRRGKGGFYSIETPSVDTDASIALREATRAREVSQLVKSSGSERFVDVPIELIHPNPFQARKHFKNLEELRDAIAVQGFKGRLLVRKMSGTGDYQIASGERRLRAAVMTGRTSLPCEVEDLNDTQMRELGLMENLQREDLEPMEEALAFKELTEKMGYTVRSLADRLGKHKDYVGDRLALLNTPSDVQAATERNPNVAIRAMKEIGSLPTAEMRKPLIESVIEKKMPVSQVRIAVAQLKQQTLANQDKSAPELPSTKATITKMMVTRDIEATELVVRRWVRSLADPNIPNEEKEIIAEVLRGFIERLQKFDLSVHTDNK